MAARFNQSQNAMTIAQIASFKEGDTVIIECEGQRFAAVVEKRSPRGDFTVSWYAGRNRFAPGLPGHWCTEFGPYGEPKYDWELLKRS